MKPESKVTNKSLRERNKERTRQELVECALRLFQEQGFDNVPVEMICEAVGISRATFFNYFPQKELIFMTIAEERMRTVQQFLGAIAQEDHGYSYQNIIKLFVTVARENERDSKRVKYILQQMLQRPSLQGMARQSRQHVQDFLIFILTNMAKQGEPLNGQFTINEIAKYLATLYFATILEWLMTEDCAEGWLPQQIELRFEMAAKGVLISPLIPKE